MAFPCATHGRVRLYCLVHNQRKMQSNKQLKRLQLYIQDENFETGIIQANLTSQGV